MTNEEKKAKKFNLLLLIIVLVLGILLGFLFLFYFWKTIPNVYLKALNSQDLNLNSPEYGKANFIIQEPKKVYINQDIKIEESHNYLEESVLGLFPKIKNTSTQEEVYILEEALMSGLVISSDGWVLFNVLGKNDFNKKIINEPSSFVLIAKKNKKLYDLEDVFYDQERSLLLVKINKVNSLAVRNFINISELNVGHSVLAYNFKGNIMLNSIKEIDSGPLIKFSDNFSNKIILNSPLDESYKNSFLFNLNGDLLALVDTNLKLKPIHDLRPSLYNFLKNKKTNVPLLGVYYTDLGDLWQEDLPNYGALINNGKAVAVVKGSLADLAGLEDGDVIIKINNYEIDDRNNLNDVLNNFIIGDKINLSYWRNKELKEVKIELK